ncbi:MAG: hypothetical protein KF799_00175 [Bdellovibrionales bacterium]|nr:hypothetical protein [Bdellovibrionales bacterium]
MLKLMLGISLSFTSLNAMAAQQTKKRTPMELAAVSFNLVQTPDRLFSFLKIGASDGDAAYLEAARITSKSKKLPLARGKGDLLYIQGLDKPFKAEDLQKGIFSYNGRKFTLDFSKGYRANMETLEKIVDTKSFAFIDWILPQAHAGFDLNSALFGAMTGGGLGMMFGSQNSNMQMAGGILALGGVVGLVASNNNGNKGYYRPQDYPYRVACQPQPSGVVQAQVLNQYGQPLAYASPYAGGYQVGPMYGATPSYPMYNQYAGQQLYGYCSSPANMASVNAALVPAYPAQPVFYRGYSMPQPRSPASTFPSTYVPASTADTGVGTAQ